MVKWRHVAWRRWQNNEPIDGHNCYAMAIEMERDLSLGHRYEFRSGARNVWPSDLHAGSVTPAR
jgi:hypothetical protein